MMLRFTIQSSFFHYSNQSTGAKSIRNHQKKDGNFFNREACRRVRRERRMYRTAGYGSTPTQPSNNESENRSEGTPD